MTAEAIGNLYARLGINTASFDSGIASAQSKLAAFGKTGVGKGVQAGLSEIEGGLQNLTAGLGVAGNILAGLGITGAAAGAAIAVAFSGAREAMAFGDEIADTAAKLRVTTDYLQEMRYAAHQLGGDFEDADRALENFGKVLGLARSGLSAKAAKPFEALGLDPKNFATVEAGLEAVTAKIAGLGNAAEQAAIADKLGLTPLLPALREGTAAIEEMRKAARTIGYVMDSELIAKAGAANDEYEALTKVLDVQFKSAMVDAIPLVMGLTRFMVDSAKAASWLAERLEDVARFGGMIGSLDPFAQADIQEARKYDAERKKRMEAAKADFMRPGARGAASNLSAWLGSGSADQATELKNLIDAEAKESAAARAAAKANREAAAARREHAAEIKALTDAMRESEQRSADFAASLLEEITTMGMSSEQIKRRNIELMAAAAPTQALANFIRQLGEQYEEQAKVGQEAAERTAQVKDQQAEQIVTINDLADTGRDWTDVLRNMSETLGLAADASRGLAWDVDDIARAINDNDWTGAFDGLIKVLGQVDLALGKNATSLQKMQALAGVGMGIGSIVGGTAGAGISGAASGALGGFSLVSSLAAAGTVIPGIGNVAGALIGGVLGGLGSLFGSSKAKKQQKAQEAAQRAAEEAARQQQIADTRLAMQIELLRLQGKEQEAVNLERKAELDALARLDASLVAQKQALYDAIDAANAKAAADEAAAATQAKAQALQDRIDALTMSDAELLAKARARERAELVAVAPELAGLIDKLFGLEDAASASAAAAERATLVRERTQSIQDRIDALTMSDAELLAKARARERAELVAVAPELAGLIDQLFGLEDAAAAASAAVEARAEIDRLNAYGLEQAASRAAEATQRQAEALAGVAAFAGEATSGLNDLISSLRDFLGEVELGPGGNVEAAYARAREALLTSTNPRDLPGLGRAFLAASEARGGDAISKARDAGLVRALVSSALGSARSGLENLPWLARIMQAQATGLPGFAAGGSMVIGGLQGVDRNLLSLNGVPVARVGYGETLSVTPPGISNDNGMGGVVAELRALNARMARVEDGVSKTARATSDTYEYQRRSGY